MAKSLRQRLKRLWRQFRMERWLVSDNAFGYFRALDDVWDNVPEARKWIADRREQLDPRKSA